MGLRLSTGGNLASSPIRLLTLLITLAVSAAAQPSLGQVGDPATGGPDGDSANPVMYDANAEWGNFLLRFQYQTRGYGEEAGMGSLGVNRSWLFDRFVYFVDGSARIDDDQLRPPTPSVGSGLRFLYQNWLSGDSERIFGVNFWYDGTHTSGLNPTDNYYYFQQLGVGLESLGERWDFRVNANLPVGNTVFAGPSTITTSFDEHFLEAQVAEFKRYAVRSVEGEVARRIGDRNLWAFASCYGLDGGGEQVVGAKAGLRGYLRRDVLASLSIANDGMFDTTVMFNITWFLDWGAHGRAEMAPACLTDRLREPVQRSNYVAVLTKQETAIDPVTDASGTPLYFVHADSNAPAGGDGTFEHPFNNLTLAETNSAVGNYLYLHGNSIFTGQSVTLKNAQSLFGEGVPGGHAISAFVAGQPTTVTLPDTGGAIPEIFNAPGASAVQLANNNNIWGLVIDTAVNGITAPSGTTNATINHVTAQNMAGAGLNFQATSGSVTVGQYTYASGTGSGINVQNSNANFAFTDISVSNSGAADAVSLTGNAGATIAFNGLNVAATGTGRGFAASGGGTIGVTGASNTITTATGNGLDLNGVTVAGSGMAFQSVTTNGATNGVSLVNVNGGPITVAGGTLSGSTGVAVVITGGTPNATIDAAIPDGAGYAVNVENTSAGSNVVFGGNITNTAAGILVKNNAGGNVAFTGAISLNTGANDAVTLTGNTASAISFNSPSMSITTTTGQGFVASSGGTVSVAGSANTITAGSSTGAALSLTNVAIDATNGMQFAGLTANGAANGILLSNVSGGTLAVAGGSISNTTGAAVNVAGGSVNVDFTGQIVQNANNAAALSVTGGHTGVMNFQPTTAGNDVITATTGTGLVFDQANGTYNIGQTTLNGGSASVAISNSNGTFTLSPARSPARAARPSTSAAARPLSPTPVRSFRRTALRRYRSPTTAAAR